MNKKIFIFRAAKILAFSLIFIYLFNCTYRVLSWKEGTAPYTSAATTLYEELDEDIVDVLFLGSSHCYSSINNAQLWDEHGIGAFDMVISGQDIASSYYYMREVFKTQSPKLVCVELYGATFENHAVTANIYRNALSFKYSDNFVNAVDAIAPEEEKMDYLLKWPIIHTRYRELVKEDFMPASPAYLGGNVSETVVTDIGDLTVYSGSETKPLLKSSEEWIQKMVDFAKENNAEICFFIAPYETDEDTHKQFRYAEQMLKKQNVPVVNFFDKIEEIGLDTHTDFADEGHTNRYGAEKITAYMGKYLKDNYTLPDRRGDETYALWEENSTAYEHKIAAEELILSENMEEYFENLSKLENCTVIITSNGDCTVKDTDISGYFRQLGLDRTFAVTGGACIINDGNIDYVTSEQNYFHYQYVDDGAVEIKGTEEGSLINFNRVEYKVVDNGFNVVVYDNILHKIVDCVGFNASKNFAANRI
ncbi:MAG: hypothetical protein IKA10_02865 [Oscillospiraceae bacterium]|nr:hypothetical protein [Oscillospiraceae bacterium]